MPDLLSELRDLAAHWRQQSTGPDPDPETDVGNLARLDCADELLDRIGEEPILPLTGSMGQVTAVLEITLGSEVFPGDPDHDREPVVLGHLVAAQVAHKLMPHMEDMRQRAGAVLNEVIRDKAGDLVDDAIHSQGRHRLDATRAELTLGEMIELEVGRQMTEPDGNAMARGRTPVPVIEALVATAVTAQLRDMTGALTAMVIDKVREDLAQEPR